MKKFTALFLAITMLCMSLYIPVFAEGTEDLYAQFKEGTGYVAIGDSFARGYGASDHWADQLYENEYYGHYNCRNVDGSYPNLVAEAFGLNAPDDIRDLDSKFWPITHDALSTAFILDLLGIDDGYRDEELTYSNDLLCNRYQTDLKYFADPLSINFEGTGTYGETGEIMSIRDMIENARLITIGLGQTDVIYKTLLLGFYNADMSDARKIAGVIAKVIDMLYENYERWKSIYPILLDYIKENNPNAEVVLVGTMNPLQNAMLSNELLIPIGSAVTGILDLINTFIKECAKKYGYLFVDISDVETIPLKEDRLLGDMLAMGVDSVDFALMIHPDPEGYEQIARLVVAAVNEDLKKKAGIASETSKTDIKVDIGSFTKLSFVLVDGKKINHYTLEDHVLTIRLNNSQAKNLTIAAAGDDGGLTLMTYHLQYHNGYSARRLYRSNNIFKTILTTLTTVFNTILNFFRGIFK